MPTVFSHPAVALAAAPYVRIPTSLVVAGVICSVLPDADVVTFALGIPYGHPLGHRGFSHSLLFAALVSAIVALCFTRSSHHLRFGVGFTYIFVCIASHGLLDAMTTGGKGIGFFVPFSNARYFLPFRPIRVSPIGVDSFAAKANLVLMSELEWVWLPAVAIALVGMLVRRLGNR